MCPPWSLQARPKVLKKHVSDDAATEVAIKAVPLQGLPDSGPAHDRPPVPAQSTRPCQSTQLMRESLKSKCAITVVLPIPGIKCRSMSDVADHGPTTTRQRPSSTREASVGPSNFIVCWGIRKCSLKTRQAMLAGTAPLIYIFSDNSFCCKYCSTLGHYQQYWHKNKHRGGSLADARNEIARKCAQPSLGEEQPKPHLARTGATVQKSAHEFELR